MTKFIKRSIAILVLSLFTSLTAHSQATLVETEDGDTMICYPKEKTKYFLKTIYRVSELTQENRILKQQLAFKDSASRLKSVVIIDLQRVNANKSTEIEMQKFEIAGLNNCIEKKDKEARRARRLSIAIATVSTVFCTYMVLRR